MSYLKKIGALFVSSTLMATMLTGCGGSSSASTGGSGSQAEGGDGNYNVGRYSNPQMDALVERVKVETDLAGLIQRKDSPNGKRYARRDKGGDIEQAFGFDLSPLLARAVELAGLAQEVAAERLQFRRCFDHRKLGNQYLNIF